MDALDLSRSLASWYVWLMRSASRGLKGRWVVEPFGGQQVELKWAEFYFLPPQPHVIIAFSPTVLSGFLHWPHGLRVTVMAQALGTSPSLVGSPSFPHMVSLLF